MATPVAVIWFTLRLAWRGLRLRHTLRGLSGEDHPWVGIRMSLGWVFRAAWRGALGSTKGEDRESIRVEFLSVQPL